MRSHGTMAIPGARELPLRDFARRLLVALSDHGVADIAAQLSYYWIFSLFPFLFFLATITAWLPLRGAVDDLLNRIAPLMPDDALVLLESQLSDLLKTPRPKLLTAGLAVTLWSASRGVDALRKGLNLAYDVKESRSWWRTQGDALALTVAVSLLVLACVTMILLGGDAGLWVANRFHVAPEFQLAWSWLRWPTTALVFMLAVAMAYYYLPDVAQEFRFITPGSVTGTALWLLVTWGFTQYAEHFGKYNVTYGSIGGVIVLLMWLYISGLALLVGGEVNAVIEHASPGGKAAGARAPGEAPAPPWERPSTMPPSAVKGPGPREHAEESRGR